MFFKNNGLKVHNKTNMYLPAFLNIFGDHDLVKVEDQTEEITDEEAENDEHEDNIEVLVPPLASTPPPTKKNFIMISFLIWTTAA